MQHTKGTADKHYVDISENLVILAGKITDYLLNQGNQHFIHF